MADLCTARRARGESSSFMVESDGTVKTPQREIVDNVHGCAHVIHRSREAAREGAALSRHFPLCYSEVYEADLSTESSPAAEAPRLPCAHAHTRRAQCPQAAQGQRTASRRDLIAAGPSSG